MPDDRTVAPSEARWSHAWRAGMRPWSGWLWPAVACGLLALMLDRLREGGDGDLALGLGPIPGSLAPAAWLEAVVTALGAGLALAGVAYVAHALVSQRLGWVAADEQSRLLAVPARPAVLARLALFVVAGVGVTLALAGALAGAARGVDASEAGLVHLWLGWALHACTALTVALGLGAIVELLLDRRERGRQLWQTSQAARDEARAAGDRSR